MEAHRLALTLGYQIEHFRIEEVLGKGGFGITYVAIDLQLGKKVAIKELRLAKGLSLRALGGKASVTAPHLSDIEQGNRQPSEELLARLAEALETALEDILRYSKRPPAKQIEELIEQDPGYGLAFRKFVDAVREKNISPEKIHDITKKLPPKKS